MEICLYLTYLYECTKSMNIVHFRCDLIRLGRDSWHHFLTLRHSHPDLEGIRIRPIQTRMALSHLGLRSQHILRVALLKRTQLLHSIIIPILLVFAWIDHFAEDSFNISQLSLGKDQRWLGERKRSKISKE